MCLLVRAVRSLEAAGKCPGHNTVWAAAVSTGTPKFLYTGLLWEGWHATEPRTTPPCGSAQTWWHRLRGVALVHISVGRQHAAWSACLLSYGRPYETHEAAQVLYASFSTLGMLTCWHASFHWPAAPAARARSRAPPKRSPLHHHSHTLRDDGDAHVPGRLRRHDAAPAGAPAKLPAV